MSKEHSASFFVCHQTLCPMMKLKVHLELTMDSCPAGVSLCSGSIPVQQELKATSTRNPMAMASQLRFVALALYCFLSFSQIVLKTFSHLQCSKIASYCLARNMYFIPF